MTRLISTSLALSAAAFATESYAQTAEPGNVQEIALTFDLRHMGNAVHTSEDAATARGLTLSDERLTVGAEVKFGRNLGRNTLNLTGIAGYDFYRENTRLNRERLGFGGDAGINAGPCLLNLSARLDRRQSDLETLELVNLPGIDSLRNAETVQTYRGEARCGYAFGLRPLFGLERTIADNSTEIRNFSNYRSMSYFAGVGYDNPVIGQLSLRYERRNVSYPDRAGTPLVTLDGYKLDEIRLSAKRDIGTFLQIDASAGYSSLRPNGGAAPNYKGLSWRIGGRAQFGSRLVVDGFTEQSLNPSMGAASAYSKLGSHQVRATFALNQSIDIGAGVFFSRKDYRGATSVFGPVLDNDRYRKIFGSVTYQMNDRLSFVLDGGNEHRNATGTFYDYSSNYIGLRGRLKI